MNELLLFFPIFFLCILIVFLIYYTYSNKQLIKDLTEDSYENDVKIKNIINAVNYNDKKLFDNQKYIYDVYEENNNFTNPKNNEKIKEDNTDQYYNMMKNYDALIHLTK